MKKKLLQIALIFSFFTFCAFTTINSNKILVAKKTTVTTNYEEGWKDGHCEGWKEEKGKNAYCPYAPYPPYPEYPKSSDSYRDGYNDGYRRGMSDARK
jgi:hypothetical protein